MKKFLAILLVALLTLGMTSAAFAENGATYDASLETNTITITKTLTANGPTGTTVKFPADTLKFTVGAGTVTNATTGVTAPTLPAIEDVSVTEGDTSATITVKLPKFENVGVYTYKITETDTNVAGVTYRTEDITLVLTVIEQEGKKVIAAVHCEAEGEDKSDTFENVFNAGSLLVSKTVAGNFGEKDKVFNFTVTFTAPTGDTVNSTITYGENTIAPSDWENGVATAEVQLKHNETIQFDNIPAGVTYSVVEAEADQDDYVTTMEGDEGEIAAKEISEAAFTNTRNTTPDTGIVLDSLPYIVIGVAVVAAAFVMIARKRRVED